MLTRKTARPAASGPEQPSVAESQDHRQQRAAIVGQLAGGILHDFNNVLTVITGTIDILADAVADRPDLAAVARLIDDAARRGARLTAHLIGFARGRPAQLVSVDIDALLADTARLLRSALGPGVEIESSVSPELPAATTDPGRLAAALLSLGIIVRDAMPEGGSIVFEGARVAAPWRATNIEAIPDHGHDESRVVITVHVYARDAAPRGCAIGDLDMVNEFVMQAGGEFTAPTRAGCDASFEIRLPEDARPARG